MKIVVSFVFASMIFAPSLVFAQDNSGSGSQKLMEEDLAIIKPGILPNSFWYWTDIFSEEIRYIFTVGRENKFDYLILLADERLAEMQTLSEEGITKYSDQLMTKHEVHISRAKDLYEAMVEDGTIKAKEFQGDFEKEILTNEYKLTNKLKAVPKQYQEGNKTIAQKVKTWFGGILSHLSSKRTEIQDQRVEFEN